MEKKSALAAALAAALVFAPLVGCANSQTSASTTTESTSAASQSAQSTEQVTGGWTVNTETAPSVTSEEQELFDKAAATYTGAQLTPVALLATQVVAGTNYAFLCTSTPVTPDAASTWCIAVVYQDLEGNAEITSVKELDLGSLKTAESSASDEQLTGGWEVAQAQEGTLPADAKTAFEAALKNYDGMALRPLALLGTQVVSGTNYLVLCGGAPVVQDPQEGLYVATVYADPSGNAEMSNVQALDLTAYVS